MRRFNIVKLEGKEYNTGNTESYNALKDKIFEMTKYNRDGRFYTMQMIELDYKYKVNCGYGDVQLEIESFRE